MASYLDIDNTFLSNHQLTNSIQITQSTLDQFALHPDPVYQLGQAIIHCTSITQYNLTILVDIPENFVAAYLDNYESSLLSALNIIQYLEIGDGVNTYNVGKNAFLQQIFNEELGSVRFFDNLNILIIHNNVTLNGGAFSMEGLNIRNVRLFPALQYLLLGCITNTTNGNGLTDFGQDTDNLFAPSLLIPQLIQFILLSTSDFQKTRLFSTVIFGGELPSPLATQLSVLADGSQHIQLLNSNTGADLSQYFSPQTNGAVSESFNNFISSTLTGNFLSSPASWDFETQGSYSDNIATSVGSEFTQTFTIKPDDHIGTYVGTILISDEYIFPNYNGIPYSGESLGFVATVPPNPSYFAISPSGVVTLIASLPITFASEIVEFQAFNGAETLPIIGNIIIKNENSPSANGIITINPRQIFTVRSNESPNSIVGTISANSPGISRFTFSILSESEYIALIETVLESTKLTLPELEFVIDLILLESYDLLTYSQYFNIGTSGVITTIQSLDNAPTTIYLLAQAAANGKVSLPQVIQINIVQNFSSQTFNINPSIEIGISFGQLYINGTDTNTSTTDGDSHIFSIISQSPSPRAQFDIISGNELALASGTLISGQTYTIIVRAINATTQTHDDTPIYIMVQSPPSIQNQTFNITTNFDLNQEIGAIFVSGPNNDHVTLSIISIESTTTDDSTILNNDFEIDIFTLKTTSTAVLVPGTVILIVTAKNNVTELSNTAIITINITEYQSPTINNDQVFYIKKDLPTNSFVGYISAIDPNGGNITFTDVTVYTEDSPQLFTVENSGAIFVNAALTLETQTLTIDITNSGGLSATTVIVIDMISVILNQTFDINTTIKPNTAFAAVLIDGNINNYSFAITTNDSPITFNINLTNAQLTYVSGALGSIGDSYNITITATNTTTLVEHTAIMTIIITADASFSIIPDQVFTITTNHTTVGNISYDNPSGGTVTFTPITTGNFALSTTGLLTINGTNPGPGTYVIAVVANSVTTTITVIIFSNTPIIQNEKFTISTYYGASKLIGALFASDIDGLPIILSIESVSPSSALSSFTISNDNQLMTTSSFTNLAVGTVTLTIQASDSTSSIVGTSQAITLIQVIPSAFVVQNQTFIISITAAIGSNIGAVVVSNPDNVPLHFALSTTSVVSINSTTGTLTLVSTSIFAAQLSCQAMVTVTSADNVSQTISITVTLATTVPTTVTTSFTIIWALIGVVGLMGIAGIVLGAIALSNSRNNNGGSGSPINVIKLC